MASDQEVEALLPCPFCGSISKIIDYSSTSVECTGCPCSLDGAFSTPEAAIAAWNTRQAAAAIPPSGEAVAWSITMADINGDEWAPDFTSSRTKAEDHKQRGFIVRPLYAAPPAPVAIDEAMVERASEALFLTSKQQFCRLFPSATAMEWDWTTLSEKLREDTREKARAALLAALNLQPNGGA